MNQKKQTNRTAKYTKGKEKGQKIGNYMTTCEEQLHKEEHKHTGISVVSSVRKNKKLENGKCNTP